jgi:hypothetical protein
MCSTCLSALMSLLRTKDRLAQLNSTQVNDVVMFKNAEYEQWTSGEYQMETYEDLYHDANVFGEAMDETLKCDSQDLQSETYSLATPGAYILSKAINEALKCDSIILLSDKYSFVTYEGNILLKGILHTLFHLESMTQTLQKCGARSEIISHDGLVMVKGTDDIYPVLEAGIKMITILWI